MQKLLRRIIGRKETNPQELEWKEALGKRYVQNVRLLDEFPWLWAVHSSWELATDEILVTDSGDYGLGSRVMDDVKNHPLRIEGMFVHGSKSLGGKPFEFVDAVWIKGQACDEDTTWEKHLKTAAEEKRSTLLHVVTITPTRNWTMVIRPRKPHNSFNDIWAWESFVS